MLARSSATKPVVLFTCNIPSCRTKGEKWSETNFELDLITINELCEVAGPVAVVELPADQPVPAIFASAVRPGQAEDQRTLHQPGTGTALHGGKAHSLKACQVPDRLEAVDCFVEQRPHGFRRYVAPGEARAARRDHN